MGDPRRLKKTYQTPFRAWDSKRIEKENAILEKYGLRRKKEIWKAENILREIRSQAKELQSTRDPLMTKQLMDKVNRLNLVGEKATLDDILSLNLENILDRRLQTIMVTKGLARTPHQARQFITHGHVIVGDRKIVWPSFLVPKELEAQLQIKKVKVN